MTPLKFIRQAKARNIDINSSSFRGKLYEIQTSIMLSKLLCINAKDISIQGGAYDQGIDLRASWDLRQYLSSSFSSFPSSSSTSVCSPSSLLSKNILNLELIIQCKTSSRKIPAKIIRELHGTHSQKLPSLRYRNQVFAMLVSNNALSKDATLSFMEIPTPMIYICMDFKGVVSSYFQNVKAKSLLEGLRDYEVINEAILRGNRR